MRRGPELRAARTLAAHPVPGSAGRAGRRVDGRPAVVAAVLGSGAAEPRPRRHREQPRPQGGVRPCGRVRRRCREVVPVSAGRRRLRGVRRSGVTPGGSAPHQGSRARSQLSELDAERDPVVGIDLFGRLRRGREAAFAQYLASEEGRRAVIVTLVGDIASTRTSSCRSSTSSSRLPTGPSRSTRTPSCTYSTRLQGGVSNRLEVDQAKANRAVTAASIPNLEQQIVLAENALSVLLGRPPAAIARGGSLSERLIPPSVPAGLPAQLLMRRPDVVQAEQFLVAANADVGAARALYPTISLTGSGGSVSGALSDFMRPDAMVWSLAAGIFQPLFTGGRIKQNYEAAKARFDQALARPRRPRSIRTGGGGFARDNREARPAADRNRIRSGGAAGRDSALPLPLRHRAVELSGSPNRGPAAVPAGAAARPDARGAVARRGPVVPFAWRGLAAGAAATTSSSRRREVTAAPGAVPGTEAAGQGDHSWSDGSYSASQWQQRLPRSSVRALWPRRPGAETPHPLHGVCREHRDPGRARRPSTFSSNACRAMRNGRA